MRYAIVIGGVVTQAPVLGPVGWDNPDAVLIPDGLPVVPGWTWNGSTFSPPARVLSVVQAQARAQVETEFYARLALGAEPVPGLGRFVQLSDPDDWLSISVRGANTLNYPYPVECTDGGSTYEIDGPGTMGQAWKDVLDRRNTIYQDRGVAIAAITAATTPEQVDTALTAYLTTTS